MQKRVFKLEEVISAVRGVLLCDIGQIYEVLNFLTGDDLMTHQLPRAGKDVQPSVFAQHPFLKDLDLSRINKDTWKQELDLLKKEWPNELELTPMKDYMPKDPLEEIIEMKGGSENVIIVAHD